MGGGEIVYFLTTNNFTIITAISEILVGYFLASNSYVYLFVVWCFVVLIESGIVWIIEKYFYISFDYSILIKYTNGKVQK